MAYYNAWLDTVEQKGFLVRKWRYVSQMLDTSSEEISTGALLIPGDNNLVMWACAKSCDARLLSQLLDVAGDDLPLYHMDEDGRNSLHIACFLCNDIEVIRSLIWRTRGGHINNVCKEGYSPLMYACRRAVSSNFPIVTHIVRSLLAHPGLNLTLINKRGKTALDIAKLSMNKEIEQLLEARMQITTNFSA